MLVPESEECKKLAYLETFKSWIKRNADQAYLFCEHGKYCGATGPGSFLHRCETCKPGEVE